MNKAIVMIYIILSFLSCNKKEEEKYIKEEIEINTVSDVKASVLYLDGYITSSGKELTIDNIDLPYSSILEVVNDHPDYSKIKRVNLYNYPPGFSLEGVDLLTNLTNLKLVVANLIPGYSYEIEKCVNLENLTVLTGSELSNYPSWEKLVKLQVLDIGHIVNLEDIDDLPDSIINLRFTYDDSKIKKDDIKEFKKKLNMKHSYIEIMAMPIHVEFEHEPQ